MINSVIILPARPARSAGGAVLRGSPLPHSTLTHTPVPTRNNMFGDTVRAPYVPGILLTISDAQAQKSVLSFLYTQAILRWLASESICCRNFICFYTVRSLEKWEILTAWILASAPMWIRAGETSCFVFATCPLAVMIFTTTHGTSVSRSTLLWEWDSVPHFWQRQNESINNHL